MVGTAKVCADVAVKQFPELTERVELTNDKFDMKIMKMTNQITTIQKDITKLPGGEADDNKYVALQA